MAFKKSNSSAGEEFAARKRPPLRSNDQIDVNDIETLKYYITDYGKILPARITGATSASPSRAACPRRPSKPPARRFPPRTPHGSSPPIPNSSRSAR